MTKPSDPVDVASLIPDLQRWNGGAGISPTAWIGHVGSYELAGGYAAIFWPAFVRFEGYVLREGFDESALHDWERAPGVDRQALEKVMNHVHLSDLHPEATDPTEAQLRHLGRVLRDTHVAKLAADFPELRFEVTFNDQPGLDPSDHELTFWLATP